MSPLFQAAAEATEEAIYNSLFRATTVTGHRGTVEAIPLDAVLEVLERYNALDHDRRLPPPRASESNRELPHREPPHRGSAELARKDAERSSSSQTPRKQQTPLRGWTRAAAGAGGSPPPR